MNHPAIARLRAQFEAGLATILTEFPEGSSAGIYDPIHYLLKLGGKRLRPVLAMAAAEAEGGEAADALPVALAVETFHNFTLMHDDIMDAAPLRRGQPTVHLKWGDNAAILSGDTMYTLASLALAQTQPAHLPAITRTFYKTALEVCVGQQLDMSFERRADVTIPEYIEMIRLKTSVLLAGSLAMGATSAGASAERQAAWYRFGERIGLAFQIQDDLLDTFGDEAVGKQIGGDILADKKTYLWIHTAASAKADELSAWSGVANRPAEKIEAIRSAMVAAGADEAAREAMHTFVDEAMAELGNMGLHEDHHVLFAGLARMVTDRVS
jgi:geranylgeranyl diphosphate synthase type II